MSTGRIARHLTCKRMAISVAVSEMPFGLFFLVSCGPAYFTIITSARYRRGNLFLGARQRQPYRRLERVIWMCGSRAAMMPPALRISNGPCIRSPLRAPLRSRSGMCTPTPSPQLSKHCRLYMCRAKYVWSTLFRIAAIQYCRFTWVWSLRFSVPLREVFQS